MAGKDSQMMQRFVSTRVIVRSVPVSTGHDARTLALDLGLPVTSACPLSEVEYMVRDRLAAIHDDVTALATVTEEAEGLRSDGEEPDTEISELKADRDAHESNAESAIDLARCMFHVACAVLGIPVPVPAPVIQPSTTSKRSRARKAA